MTFTTLAEFRTILEDLPATDKAARQGAEERNSQLTKPPAALGRLSADQLVQRGRENFLARRYGKAEQAFRAFLVKYGNDPRAPEVKFELGETLYVQGRFKEAGRMYVDVYKNHPDSRIAPAALLRLGQALRRMGKTKEACKTWATLKERFPDSREALRRVPREMKRAKCAKRS
jgi:tol-pal system protein YbgF